MNLKPCPFCGCKDIRIRHYGDFDDAACKKCDAMINLTPYDEGRHKTIEQKWNTRVEVKDESNNTPDR